MTYWLKIHPCNVFPVSLLNESTWGRFRTRRHQRPLWAQPRACQRKDRRVRESLQVTGSSLVQTIPNCCFPSSPSGRWKTALSMGRCPASAGDWCNVPSHQGANLIWVTTGQRLVSRPAEAAGLQKPPPSVHPAASPSAGKTVR